MEDSADEFIENYIKGKMKCPLCNKKMISRGCFEEQCINTECGLHIWFTIGDAKLNFGMTFRTLEPRVCKCCKQEIKLKFPSQIQTRKFIIKRLQEHLKEIASAPQEITLYVEEFIKRVEKEITMLEGMEE